MSDKALIERANAFLAEGLMSAADLARQLGVSPSTFSRWRSGAYPGNASFLEMGLRERLDRFETNRLIRRAAARRNWLVRVGNNLRLVKRHFVLKRLLSEHPDAFVIQIWMGEEVRQTYCVPAATGDMPIPPKRGGGSKP